MANPIRDPMYSQQNRQSKPLNPIEMMIEQNPHYQEVMAYIQCNGGSAKSAFYSLCQERGFDPNQIISSLQHK